MVLADALRDFQVCLADVLKQFGKFRTHGRVLLEQQLLEHNAVDANHLLEMGSIKVHEDSRF